MFRHCLIALVLTLSAIASASQNEFVAKVRKVMATENGLYIQVDKEFPAICSESSSSYLLIPSTNMAGIILVSSNMYSHFSFRTKYDHKSLDCIVIKTTKSFVIDKVNE